MTSYYGGRTKCKIRKVPTKVTVLDFTSMYPTVTMLMNLWKYIMNQDTWKKLIVMVRIQPDEDILPVRMDYKGDNKTYNVGVNYLKSSRKMWYSLPDIVSSYLLTGKAPKVIEAVKFIPKCAQKSLKKTMILGIDIDRAYPKTHFHSQFLELFWTALKT